MKRDTIDYGIDLGTTNSEIAVLEGTQPQIITNQEGATFTPSAVWIDKRNRLNIGRGAYNRVDDPDQIIEFKLLMGDGDECKKVFPQSGREMLPEELSAEVLKSLKTDVNVKKGEDIQAAVVTVPAAFEIDQCDATREAAELAGLTQSPLLQEPVAAALAYGFQSVADNEFWMVYDFGGGTFDAAVIQVRDGIIQVVNHAGDNYLGGQRIDWDIVNKKLIPQVEKQCSVTDFRRGNEKWRAAIARLKLAAEKAKIQVCRKKQVSEIYIEPLLKDETGQTVDFEYELTPDDVKEAFSSYIRRSLNLSKKALTEANLSAENIEKILMVGGSTLNPWLREKVQKELGIQLEFSIDPITVVALGAAIFAGTQKLKTADIEVPAGSFKVDLEYDPVGTETDPTIGGRVTHPQESGKLKGYTIEFIETKSRWRSGKVTLNDKGSFMTEVHAEKERKCNFLIELCDPTGTKQQTIPQQLSYTVGMSITNPPLTHNIGVAMVNNKPDFFLEKGTPLPARVRHIHKTVYPVRKGQKGELIKIILIEGENTKWAYRNDDIGSLIIPSDKVKRDVPAGSEVEITINMDESRMLTAKAYIPILDETFERVFDRKSKPTETVTELQESFEKVKERLAQAREKAEHTNNPKAKQALAKIEQEQIVQEVESLSEASEADPGAAHQFQNELNNLEEATDDLEDAAEWPNLLQEVEEQLQSTRQVVDEDGTAEETQNLQTLEEEMQKAIDSGNPDILREHIEQIRSIGMQIVLRKPEIWIYWLQDLEKQTASMTDVAQAERLFEQGRRAVNNEDFESLKAAVQQLFALLPREQQEEIRGYGGTTIRDISQGW